VIVDNLSFPHPLWRGQGGDDCSIKRREEMPIRYHPGPGEVLFCTFPEPGETPHAPPEMTKRRRVIVLSPRLWQKQRNTLVVVPISTTAPFTIEPRHYQLTGSYPNLLPGCWVKGDMVLHAAYTRLSPIIEHGRLVKVVLTSSDLEGARSAVVAAIGR
jgi:uncharacterized protein YifN (PemK superfamily)